MNLPQRKPTRLRCFDYSTAGAYFITICTKEKKKALSNIEENKNQLSEYGKICDKYINNINEKYKNAEIDKYVIMPNHIHMIIFLSESDDSSHSVKNVENIIRTFKILVSKEIGMSIWQRSYHDHIIRGKHDYVKIWEYIDTNVAKWELDCFYM